jgi:hypothetical protein
MTLPLFPFVVACPTAEDHWLSLVGESVPARGISLFARTSIESLTRRTAPGMLRVGEDRLGSGVGLRLFASVLSSKTIDGMRKLFSAPVLQLAFCVAESGIAAWSCDKAVR